MSFDSSSKQRELSSQRVSQIFDSYMTQIAPKLGMKPPTSNSLPQFTIAPKDKENSFSRSNYHKQSFCVEQQSTKKLPLSQKSNQSLLSSSPGAEQPKLTRSDSSSVLAMKALQQKLTDLEISNNELRSKDSERQANLDSLKQLYSQMQQAYSKLESEHRELIPALTKYQQDILLMKAQKEKQMKDLSSRFEEQLQFLKRESEKCKFLEVELLDSKNLLEDSLNDLKKERQNTQKLKQEFRAQMDKNDKQFEEQIEYYLKINSQLQEQVQKLINAESKQSNEKYDLQKKLTSLQEEHEKVICENKDLKTLYQEQLNYMEKDVKKVFEQQKAQIASLSNTAEQDSQRQKEVEKLQSQVANLQELSSSFCSKLEKEQMKNSQLELQLSQIVNQIKGASSNKKNKTEEPIIIQKQDQSSEQKWQKYQKNDEESVFSYEEKSSLRDQEYSVLLQEIIEVEQVACELNQQYQYYFSAYSQVSNSEKNELKQQMNEIMNRIKINNSKLYDLKSKEFFLLSQSVS